MLKFFRVAFGLSGTRAPVPDAADPSGFVSYIEGYGVDYQRAKTDPLSKNIERDKMNQLFFDATTAIGEIQSQGIPDFITSALNGGSPFSYAKNAVVRYSDGNLYQSAVAANTSLPTDATKWLPIDFQADALKALANYTALRAYTGQATAVRITQFGISGIFQFDASDTTSADNGGTIIVDASNRRWVRVIRGQSVLAKWFEVKMDWNGTTGTDNTTKLQAAINYASKVGFPNVQLDAGAGLFSRLYFFYDAALNPGFNQTVMGRTRLKGEGQLNHSEANTWPANGWYGSVLLSSVTTGDAITVSPASADGGTYPARQNVLEDLTVIANTTGFVVKHNCAISSQMRNVTVMNLNAAGSGVYWHSAWFTEWENVWITNVSTTGQTGTGVDFGSTLFAGSFRFSNCTFERFQDGFRVNESGQSVALLFDGVCTFQSNARDGLQINAAFRSLVLDTPYMEFNGRSHIRCAPASGSMQSLAVRSGFMLGGTSGATSMSGPMVYLRSVTNYSIDGLSVFRPWTDIVDVAYYATNGTIGAIKNTCVDATDNNPTTDIFLVRVDDQRAMPVMEGNTIFGDANVKEYDSGLYRQNAKLGNGIESAIWNQPIDRRTMDLNGTTFLQSANCSPVQIFNITGGGSFVSLPGSPGQGRYIVVANQVSSSSSTLVRQPDQTTNLVTLNAGQAALCYFEPFAGKYVAIGPIPFAGL